MERDVELRDRDFDRLLAGDAPLDGAPCEELVAFVRDLKAVYGQSPEAAAEAAHLAAILEVSRSLTKDEPGVPSAARQRSLTRRKNMFSSRFALAGKLAAGALTAVLATAGLAVAGVDLPDPADDAFGKLGLSLPNQAGGEDRSGPATKPARNTDVRGVIESTDPSDRDCSFGHAVAQAARGSELPEQAQAACERGKKGDEDSTRERGGRNGGGEQNGDRQPSAGRNFGQQTAEGAKQLRDATPQERQQFGRDTSERAKQLGGAPEPQQQSGHQEGAGAQGRETGQSYSEQGQSIGDQASGGRRP